MDSTSNPYTHKERVIRTLARQPVNYLPTYITFTQKMYSKMAKYFGVRPEDLYFYLDNHIIQVGLSEPVRIVGSVKYDSWGIGWDLESEGFLIRHYPLMEDDAWVHYRFPDPSAPGLMDKAIDVVRRYGDEYFIISDQGFLLWERAWCLRGFEQTLIDFIEDPARVEDLLDRITEYQIAVAQRFIKARVDGGYTGDDYGTQRGLLFSPDTWRHFIKPRLARIWKVYKDAGLPVFHHSCGDVRPIIPDMIEIGLDVLMPIQPQAMPLEELKEEYGDRLAFLGGICTQKVLPFSSPEEIRREVSRVIDFMGRGGGYIIGPSHDITSDVPVENVLALLETLDEHRRTWRESHC